MADAVCVITTRISETTWADWATDAANYEIIKEMLESRQKGWFEINHAHSDGKILINLEEVKQVLYRTPSMQEAIVANPAD